MNDTQNLEENVSLFLKWWDQNQTLMITKGLQLIFAIVIFLVGRKVIQMLLKLFDRIMERSNCELSIRSFGKNAMRALLYLVLVLIILQSVGFEVTSLAAILASAGVAVGLALQGSLSNLASGLLILAMHPFRVGDVINTGVYVGTVKEIGLIYTVMVTPDDRTIVAPNSILSGNVVENFSTQENRRVDVQIGIAYEADLKKAKEVFMDLLMAIPERLEDMPVDVFVADLAASSVVIEGRVWVPGDQYFPVIWAVRENLKLAYDEHDIKIPYNQLEVHMDQSK